jgi:LuxR family quorum sensing-dependent transcriptional regulator
LTGPEQEVLKWAAVGKSVADTAEILSVTRRTVTAHTVNAMDNLGAANKGAGGGAGDAVPLH